MSEEEILDLVYDLTIDVEAVAKITESRSDMLLEISAKLGDLYRELGQRFCKD